MEKQTDRPDTPPPNPWPAHLCRWPGCSSVVPRATFMCGKHWAALPISLRTAVSKTWKGAPRGAEASSPAYREAARLAIEYAEASVAKGLLERTAHFEPAIADPMALAADEWAAVFSYLTPERRAAMLAGILTVRTPSPACDWPHHITTETADGEVCIVDILNPAAVAALRLMIASGVAHSPFPTGLV